jgi:HJR/Mrr/RecB family endonuclease
LSPSGFEKFVTDLFERLGYQRVTLRGRSGDQGADILAERMDREWLFSANTIKA